MESATLLIDPEEAQRRLDVVERRARELFRPPPPLTVREWADLYRYLSPEASAEPGKWRTDRAPYQAGPMDAISDPRVQDLVLIWASQLGKTETLNNILGYFIDQDPSPILVVMPTLELAEAWSKDRLAPMLRDTPRLRGRVKDARSRDSGNTIRHKTFPGGHLTAAGANSPASLAARPIRVVLADEIDRYPVSAGTEGDPVALAFRRTATFWSRKRVVTSTPTIKDKSAIERAWLKSDQRRYYVPCPHCEHYQVLRWGGADSPYGIKWDKDLVCRHCGELRESAEGKCVCGASEARVVHKPETAAYECENCHALIQEHDKYDMLRAGRWVAENPESKVAGFHLNALYSPWARWAELVDEWLKAQDNPEALKVFINTVLAETYEEEEEEEELDPRSLEARAESYTHPDGSRIEVPDGVGLLVAWADVQHDRIEVLIRGFGAREESWMIAHHRLYGSTASPDAEVYRRLDAIRRRAYRHQNGAELRIQVFGIDSGDGTRTAQVYDYVRLRQHEGVVATKGQGINQRDPVRVETRKRKGRPIKLVNIGTQTLKAMLFSRLGRTLEPGQPVPWGYMHFRSRDDDWHNGADAEYYAQFARERPERRRLPSGQWVTEWKGEGRNEAIDLEVGCLAMLYYLGPATRDALEQLARQVSEQKRAPARRARRRVLHRGVSV